MLKPTASTTNPIRHQKPGLLRSLATKVAARSSCWILNVCLHMSLNCERHSAVHFFLPSLLFIRLHCSSVWMKWRTQKQHVQLNLVLLHVAKVQYGMQKSYCTLQYSTSKPYCSLWLSYAFCVFWFFYFCFFWVWLERCQLHHPSASPCPHHCTQPPPQPWLLHILDLIGGPVYDSRVQMPTLSPTLPSPTSMLAPDRRILDQTVVVAASVAPRPRALGTSTWCPAHVLNMPLAIPQEVPPIDHELVDVQSVVLEHTAAWLEHLLSDNQQLLLDQKQLLLEDEQLLFEEEQLVVQEEQPLLEEQRFWEPWWSHAA